MLCNTPYAVWSLVMGVLIKWLLLIYECIFHYLIILYKKVMIMWLKILAIILWLCQIYWQNICDYVITWIPKWGASVLRSMEWADMNSALFDAFLLFLFTIIKILLQIKMLLLHLLQMWWTLMLHRYLQHFRLLVQYY